jgi:asparagine synthase (glutamine-hydrolysing)
MFPEDPKSFIVSGTVYGTSGKPRTPEDVLKDPFILNDIESDASIIGYDREDDSLTLIRDPVGASPLYCAQTSRGWAAAFDLRALFKLIGEPKPDFKTLYDFLATHYRYVFRDPERTFHQGIFQVPAGCFVVIKNGSPEKKKYLDLSLKGDYLDLSFQEAADLYVSMLRENVSNRLAALKGENYAFTVSSGLDSSSVAALAAAELKKPLDCLTVSYGSSKGTPYDETAGVKALMEDTGWKLDPLEMGGGSFLKELEELMELTLAPIVTVTWLANHRLALKAREKGVTRLFSGLGGDESLAGEFEHFFLFFADLKREGKTELLERETSAWAELHSTPEFPKGPKVRDAYFERNLDFQTGVIAVDQPRYTQFREYFSPDWVRENEDKLEAPPMPTPYPYFLSNRLFQEMSYETSPPTLWSEALSSRAGGIKGLFPMASPRLFRLALSLPGDYKYENGLTKMIIRRGMKGILPDRARLNPVKTGFNVPLDLFLRNESAARKALDLLRGSPLPALGWLKKGALEKIMADHLSSARNNMMLLFPLIQTALFLKRQGT